MSDRRDPFGLDATAAHHEAERTEQPQRLTLTEQMTRDDAARMRSKGSGALRAGSACAVRGVLVDERHAFKGPRPTGVERAAAEAAHPHGVVLTAARNGHEKPGQKIAEKSNTETTVSDWPDELARRIKTATHDAHHRKYMDDATALGSGIKIIDSATPEAQAAAAQNLTDEIEQLIAEHCVAHPSHATVYVAGVLAIVQARFLARLAPS